MPTFDIVSEVDLHEVNNAIDQASREVDTRFDFKGSNAQFSLKDSELSLVAQSDFQLQQMREILYAKFAKRGVDIGSLKADSPQNAGKQVKQTITLIQGIDSALAKKIVKLVKDSKMKVQAAIQGDKVRITGKKRDDLQECIALLRSSELEQPLQFDNFRD